MAIREMVFGGRAVLTEAKLTGMQRMGFLMLHLLFGLIVGALYGAWAG